jgi:ribonuclease HI
MLTIHIDGAARGNPGPAAIGIIAKKDGKTVFEISDYIGETTNNVAEYSALIRALEETLIKGYKEGHFISDSQLIVEQIKGNYRVKEAHLKLLYNQAESLIKKLKSFSIKHIKRELNKEADKLANRALDAL